MSDAELFGCDDMSERYRVAMECLDIIARLWSQEAPFRIEGEHWNVALERLVGVVELLGPFGILVMVGHDWYGTTPWRDSMQRLATQVMPRLSQHADQLSC